MTPGRPKSSPRVSRIRRLAVRRGMRRAFSFFVLFAAAGAGAIAMGGCNAQLATVLSSDDAATQPGTGDSSVPPECPPNAFCSTDSGTTADGATQSDCEKLGGVCLAKGESPPPTYKPAGPGQGTCAGTNVCWVIESNTPIGQACVNHQDCNPSPEISALHGECFHGICVCNIGTVQPNGKCGSAVTECKTQGGTCHQMPATCPTGKVESDQPTNMTCGDFVAAVCCHDPSACKGPSINGKPVDFTCCGPAGGGHAPICANGWKTCPAQYTPVDTSKGGCL